MHMTADRSKGVILWNEDHDNQYIVRRLDFAVDDSGTLTVSDPVTILPLVAEEALPGDLLSLGSIDIWGDETHDSLYLAIGRARVFNSGPNAGEGSIESLIYNLNALTNGNDSPDVRFVYSTDTDTPQDVSDWHDAVDSDCFSAVFSRFVPTCYRAGGQKFNPSGTRLYVDGRDIEALGDRGNSWHAVLRIRIDRLDAMGANNALADWTLTGPELVYTSGPGGARPRPDNDPYLMPAPEIVTASGQFINSDQCASGYGLYANGNTLLPRDFWHACIDPDLLGHGNANSWQSPDAYLFSGREKRHYNIYRLYVSGGVADTKELIIENGRHADTGH